MVRRSWLPAMQSARFPLKVIPGCCSFKIYIRTAQFGSQHMAAVERSDAAHLVILTPVDIRAAGEASSVQHMCRLHLQQWGPSNCLQACESGNLGPSWRQVASRTRSRSATTASRSSRRAEAYSYSAAGWAEHVSGHCTSAQRCQHTLIAVEIAHLPAPLAARPAGRRSSQSCRI